VRVVKMRSIRVCVEDSLGYSHFQFAQSPSITEHDHSAPCVSGEITYKKQLPSYRLDRFASLPSS